MPSGSIRNSQPGSGGDSLFLKRAILPASDSSAVKFIPAAGQVSVASQSAAAASSSSSASASASSPGSRRRMTKEENELSDVGAPLGGVDGREWPRRSGRSMICLTSTPVNLERSLTRKYDLQWRGHLYKRGERRERERERARAARTPLRGRKSRRVAKTQKKPPPPPSSSPRVVAAGCFFLLVVAALHGIPVAPPVTSALVDFAVCCCASALLLPVCYYISWSLVMTRPCGCTWLLAVVARLVYICRRLNPEVEERAP